MRAFLVVLAVTAVAGCVTKTIPMIPLNGGDPGSFTFKTNVVAASSGDVVAELPTGENVAGRWTELERPSELESFFVNTPAGPIYGTALTQTGDRPWGVATLSGDGLSMLCVYKGTQGSGFGTCVDSRGRRWMGNW